MCHVRNRQCHRPELGSRHARRPLARIHAAIAALASVAVLAGAMTPVVTSATPAQASEASIMRAAITTRVTTSESARAPAAVVDQFGNQYVFWRGSDSQLWEGWYDIYTRKWHGPVKLGMGPLVSEPSAAASPSQVFGGPGGQPFSALFLYWEGSRAACGWRTGARLDGSRPARAIDSRDPGDDLLAAKRGVREPAGRPADSGLLGGRAGWHQVHREPQQGAVRGGVEAKS